MQSDGEFIKFLGEGGFGSVNLVKYTNNDGSSFHAAVKSSYAYNYDHLNREFQILSELRGYPRIVRCFGDSLEQGYNPRRRKVYNLLLEYASEGSLSSFMDNYIDRKLPESMIRDFTVMILQGLVIIHSHGYVHCDLKSHNILVFPSRGSCSCSYELKIADFGHALEVGDVPDFWEVDFPFLGTPSYMSPESLRDGVARKSLDIWSLGCLVLEMFTGEAPWNGFKTNDLVNRLLDGKAPEIPESVPCDAREFIEMCFARNPRERGDVYKLLSHRFLDRAQERTEKIFPVAVSEEEKITSVAVAEDTGDWLLLDFNLVSVQ
ncbi:unnamed protein product [Microthlaspi erraticum]|uniref:Protein kinase domain-containing protein n=1 Tax=Microthlaspi erraticum TaxID=1685480 RepID=A0A6D2IGE1_9BRAS|nr:unnamed protein product [Microthlaspi erraticum]